MTKKEEKGKEGKGVRHPNTRKEWQDPSSRMRAKKREEKRKEKETVENE